MTSATGRADGFDRRVTLRDAINVLRLRIFLIRRLNHARRSGDPKAVLDPRALADARQLRRLIIPADAEARMILGHLYWARSQHLSARKANVESWLAIEMFEEAMNIDSDSVPREVRDYLESPPAARKSEDRLVNPCTIMSWSPVKRFQDLAPSDYERWGPDGHRPVVCVSHRWISKNHPDPYGLQLRELQQRLRSSLESEPELADCGVLYDYW